MIDFAGLISNLFIIVDKKISEVKLAIFRRMNDECDHLEDEKVKTKLKTIKLTNKIEKNMLQTTSQSCCTCKVCYIL